MSLYTASSVCHSIKFAPEFAEAYYCYTLYTVRQKKGTNFLLCAIKYTQLWLLSLGLMYVKKITSFCQVLKTMHTEENWFLFLPHGVRQSALQLT